ncbi:MAG: molybdenum cofactor guanylyltransferase [Cyanobacteria bacterium P01_C01_bin.120]
MKLAAVILAGGRSQRMGQDKALLKKDGVTLLRRTWDVAHKLSTDVWVVTPYRDRYQACLPAETQWLDEPMSNPELPPAGPLIAFQRALSTITVDWILLLACDLPNLEAEPLRRWCQALPDLPADAIAYVPQTTNGWEPLCGFYRGSCLPALQDYLATGERSFQHWLTRSPVVAIPHVPIAMLANCNTPADWQRLQ